MNNQTQHVNTHALVSLAGITLIVLTIATVTAPKLAHEAISKKVHTYPSSQTSTAGTFTSYFTIPLHATLLPLQPTIQGTQLQ